MDNACTMCEPKHVDGAGEDCDCACHTKSETNDEMM